MGWAEHHPGILDYGWGWFLVPLQKESDRRGEAVWCVLTELGPGGWHNLLTTRVRTDRIWRHYHAGLNN